MISSGLDETPGPNCISNVSSDLNLLINLRGTFFTLSKKGVVSLYCAKVGSFWAILVTGSKIVSCAK